MLALSSELILLAAESSGDDTGAKVFFTCVLLFAGPVFYGLMAARYRNAEKRHDHRRDTKSVAFDVRAQDTHVRRVTGSSSSKMSGANHRS